MIYRFGPFHYDSDQRLLFRGADRVPLVPKAVDTLHVLLERRGQVVDKADLMRLVWPDTTVEDVGLARNISILRKALGDDESAESPLIETVPRRGYRFAPAPEAAADVPVPPRRRWLLPAIGLTAAALAAFIYYQFYVPSRYLPPARVGAASLAVVPFICLCDDAAMSNLAGGLTDLLVAELAKSGGGLHVVAPSTVRRHQKAGVSMGLMGRLLGLDALVEGTVQPLGDLLRITARLVDVHTGRVIWADSYDRPAADLAAAQSAAARDAVSAIVTALKAPRRTFE